MKRSLPQTTYGRNDRRRTRVSHFDLLALDDDMNFPSSHKIDFNPPKPPPRPPKSQKEATMPSQPDEKDVQQIIDTGIADRVNAIRYLKAKKNDVHAAINALLEGEDISKEEAASQWNDGLFAQDRDGNDSHDAPGYGGHLRPLESAAPTRGSSPVRDYIQPTSKEQEDRELAMAMSMSQGHFPEQEDGLIHSDGTEVARFGPATRESYETDQWAMVPSAVSSEIVPDVEVEGRVNEDGEPRFLKHLPGGDYLSNLLTIAHAIPGAREALLMRQHVRPEYGQDGEWWKGRTIRMPRIVHVDDGRPADREADKYDELIMEVQRLVAALDASDRSYVSPSALTQTDVIKNTTSTKTLLEFYLEEWLTAASARLGEQAAEVTNLFATDFTWSAHETERQRTVLDLANDGDQTVGLSDLLESFLWGQDTDGMTETSDYINTPADVLIIRLRQTQKGVNQLHVQPCAELHLDKYLQANISAALEVRREIAKGKARIKKIVAVEAKLIASRHPHKPNERLEAKALLKHSYSHFSGKLSSDTAESNLPNGTHDESLPDDRPHHYADIARKLDQVISSIDGKLTQLAHEKEKTRRAIADLSKNPAPGMPAALLKHRYTLRGVATKPHITYVLRPKEEELAMLEDADDEAMPLLATDPHQQHLSQHLDPEHDDATPAGMQWWRIDYEAHSASGAKASKTRTPDYDVLRAVELEHHSALLVYASDAVLRHRTSASLPQPLLEFVQRDNALFDAEREAAREPPPYLSGVYASNDDEAMDSIEPHASLDSTRGELGDADELVGVGPPDYDDDDDDFGQNRHEYGLPPRGIMTGSYGSVRGMIDGQKDDESTVEIHLDDGREDGMEMETIQREHVGVRPGLEGGGDVTMEDEGMK